ncbi:MAG: ATP-binding protein, partial [Phycisphaerae bacterium]
VGSTLMVYAGDETIRQISGPMIPTDLVALDAGGLAVDASIISSLASNEDSVVMAAPETAYAVKAWNVLREISSVIGSFLSTDELLVRMMDIIFEELEVDHAVIFVRDEATGDLLPELVRFRHQPKAPDAERPTSIITSRTIINHVVESKEGVLCSNAVTDERFRSGKSVQNLGMRSVICAPIIARDQIQGVIHLDSPVTNHIYSELELRLLTAIGFQTGVAMENARLVQSQLQRERLAAAGETVAYLSHYIKNILQGMRSGADIVERGLTRKSLEVTEQGWRVVVKNLDKSYNLMLNMLAFSKQREPNREVRQVNKIVDDAVELAHTAADDAGVVLLTDLDDTAPPIPVDADGIHQVVLNLVLNAVDALSMQKNNQGVVNVRTRYEADEKLLDIIIADNGPGIPPPQRDMIFRPFHSTKGHGGTGLGLAVAHKLVREHGGAIDLAHPVDGGVEFHVKLPAGASLPDRSGDTLGTGLD